jgi:hypothetical protein
MKKIFSILSACVLTLNVFALDYTAKLWITLSSANGENVTIKLRERADFSSATTDAGDAEALSDFYVLDDQGGRWQQWATDNLEGTRIGFNANEWDEEYNFTFTNVEGRDLYIYDAASGTSTLIVNGLTIPFTIESAQAGLAIDFRFSILEEAPVFVAQVTTNEFGWASFSFVDKDLAAFEPDLKIYTGAFDGEETLNLTEMDWYAANEGVVVFGEPNTTYHFVEGTQQSTSFDGNNLKPSTWWDNHQGTIFCLRGDALYEYTGSDFPANKAFLQIASAPNGAPRRISFRFGGTQAVDNVADEAKAVKFMENGQVFVIKNGVKFNTLGQIVK